MVRWHWLSRIPAVLDALLWHLVGIIGDTLSKILVLNQRLESGLNLSRSSCNSFQVPLYRWSHRHASSSISILDMFWNQLTWVHVTWSAGGNGFCIGPAPAGALGWEGWLPIQQLCLAWSFSPFDGSKKSIKQCAKGAALIMQRWCSQFLTASSRLSAFLHSFSPGNNTN